MPEQEKSELQACGAVSALKALQGQQQHSCSAELSIGLKPASSIHVGF